jgi:hypothetical protein
LPRADGKGGVLILKKPHPRPTPKERGVGRLKTYVFSPARHAFTDNFREVEDKVEFVALPAAIYDAYQKCCPSAKRSYLKKRKNK